MSVNNTIESLPDDLPGRLSAEQLDSLRLDCQNQPPVIQEQIYRLTASTHDMLLSFYGDYLAHPRSSEELAHRFLLTDQETHSLFFDQWLFSLESRLPLEKYHSDGQSHMRYFSNAEGGFAIGYVADAWSKVKPKERARLIKNLGDETTAENLTILFNLAYTLLHEMVHFYQDPHLPLWFMETGAYFYAHDIFTRKSFFNRTTSLGDDLRRVVKFHQYLIKKHGPDVHHLSFGTPIHSRKERAILAEMTPARLKKVFPGYQTAE